MFPCSEFWCSRAFKEAQGRKGVHRLAGRWAELEKAVGFGFQARFRRIRRGLSTVTMPSRQTVSQTFATLSVMPVTGVPPWSGLAIIPTSLDSRAGAPGPDSWWRRHLRRRGERDFADCAGCAVTEPFGAFMLDYRRNDGFRELGD
jgi:hypothetical protein